MDIKTFRLEELDLSKQPTKYHSQFYQEDFPLLPTPLGPPGRRYIVTLDALPKEEIRRSIHDFLTRLPNQKIYAGNKFKDNDDFYRDPKQHQVYRFRIPWPNEKDTISVHFRTKANDKETDDYLSAFEEAVILRGSVRGKFLNLKIEEDFPTEYQRFLERVPDLAKQKVVDLERMPGEGYKKDHIRFYGLMLFNCLGIMKRAGYTPERTLEIAGKIKIGSPFIFGAVRGCFK
jgi:hypothetical protein